MTSSAAQPALAHRVIQAVLPTALALLMVSTMLVGAAAADTPGCGDVLTEDTTLTGDVGPCDGEGLIIAADGITLNLWGATRSAATPQPASISRWGPRGVTVRGSCCARSAV